MDMAEQAFTDLISAAQPPEEALAPTPAPTPAPAAQPEPASAAGDQGDSAQPPLSEKELKGVFSGMMDERAKRQEAVARAEKLERELADYKARQAAAAPSFKDNPEAAMQANLAQQRFDMSEELALNSGMKQDEIDAAKTWGMEKARGNPGFAAEYLRARSPITWVVQQHRRDKLMTDVGDDPDAYVRRRAAELGYAAPAEGQQPAGAAAPAPQPAETKPSTLRPSLASAPSAGAAGAIPVGGMAAVEALPFMRH